ncbi:MAG: hypothetical protein IKT67_05565 [Lachnospiraceae bacterium]|nr:hypothetical protein [Lachnospiraceae bacterium]
MKNKTNIWHLLSKIFFWVALGLILLGVVIIIALSRTDREFGLLFGGAWAATGAMFGLFALGMLLSYKAGEGKKKKLMESGRYVMADIVDIDMNRYQTVQMGAREMYPYFIVCSYTDGSGQEYIFKSKNLYYNPSGLLRSNQLKVYVDLAKPRKYYVDTDAILPENAVLHKWKNDTKRNAERLIAEGNYVNATTCGVEHQGHIIISGACLTQFVKLSGKLAEKLNLGVDEKNRAYFGYTILCRYDAPNGTPHIFASKIIYGEAKSDFVDQPVRVYYRGKDFKDYHVDVRGLGFEE